MKKIRVINVYVWLFGVIAAILVILAVLHSRFQNIMIALFMIILFFLTKFLQKQQMYHGSYVLPLCREVDMNMEI
ncbi:MAG: hypothetical protein ACI39Q_06335 [Wujia sp.]